MARHRLQSVHRVIAGMLALAMMVCCCQAHLALHWLSDDDRTLDAVITIDSCCSTACATEDAPSASDDTDEPCNSDCETGCKVCCVKGSGRALELELPADAVVPTPAPVAVVTLTAPCVTSPRPERPHRGADPPTLLHLRCALIV